MTHKKLSPPGATGGAQNYYQQTTFDSSEHNHSDLPLQYIRTRFLARRFRLAPTMAAAVAEIAFEAREVAR